MESESTGKIEDGSSGVFLNDRFVISELLRSRYDCMRTTIVPRTTRWFSYSRTCSPHFDCQNFGQIGV